MRDRRGVLVRLASGTALLMLSLLVVTFARLSRAVDAVERAAMLAGVSGANVADLAEVER